MNVPELADHIYIKEDLETKAQAKRIVEEIFDEIAKQLTQDEVVNIAGFGKFEAITRKARKGRNPQTGEQIQISAKKVAKFKERKELKHKLNGK